jgi:hypothetical protein
VEVRLPTKHLSQTPQSWELCALGTTFFDCGGEETSSSGVEYCVFTITRPRYQKLM